MKKEKARTEKITSPKGKMQKTTDGVQFKGL
jgi:hypothetical protein